MIDHENDEVHKKIMEGLVDVNIDTEAGKPVRETMQDQRKQEIFGWLR